MKVELFPFQKMALFQLRTKIDTLHEITWGYDKHVVTLLKDEGGDCR